MGPSQQHILSNQMKLERTDDENIGRYRQVEFGDIRHMQRDF
jgi:hypothetical protein